MIRLNKYKTLKALGFPAIEENGAVPLIVRTTVKSLVYVDEPYIVCRSMLADKPKVTIDGVDYYVEPVEQNYCSWYTIKRYGPGIYEWKAKLNGVDYGEEFAGGFENHHGWPNEGIITVYNYNGTLSFVTNNYELTETSNISGVDMTNENTYRIEWTENYVKLYVNGVLKANHTTAVPTMPMMFFCESMTRRGEATKEAIVYFRLGSLKKIA